MDLQGSSSSVSPDLAESTSSAQPSRDKVRVYLEKTRRDEKSRGMSIGLQLLYLQFHNYAGRVPRSCDGVDPCVAVYREGYAFFFSRFKLFKKGSKRFKKVIYRPLTRY